MTRAPHLMRKFRLPLTCALELALLSLSVLFVTGAGPVAAQDFSAPVVERGRYLAVAGDCTSCHTKPDGGKPFAGGYAIASPIGAIYSSNITPSRVAGIGAYSERDFDRALREGLRADGAHLYPAMPYTAYVRLSDEDVHALYAYFMKGVAPVDTQPPKTKLPFPFNLRFSMALWNALFLKSERFTPDPSKDAEWNRGAYLVTALEHCSVCHSPRNVLMTGPPAKRLPVARSDHGMRQTLPRTRLAALVAGVTKSSSNISRRARRIRRVRLQAAWLKL